MIHKVGERLSKYRKDRKMSQEELASLLNVTRQTISKWETGDTLPDMYNAVALAKMFHVSLDHFILGSAGKYGETSYFTELRDKRKKTNLKAILIGSFGSTMFAVIIALTRAFSVDSKTEGIVFACTIPVIFSCWLYAIWGLIKTGRINEEIKYLEQLEMVNTQKNNYKES